MDIKTFRGALAVSVWLGAISFGLEAEWSYAATPSPAAYAMPSWPARSSLPREAGKPALILFAHPRCPCTRASLIELASILPRAPDASATVVFVRPDGAEPAWLAGDSWELAAKTEGVRVLVDDRGVEAARFAALTSGTVLVYGREGQLRFSGGITPLRGHEGDNSGADDALAALLGKPQSASTHPVFGCALVAASELEAVADERAP